LKLLFQKLKSMLLGVVVHQPQEEILIERVPVWLVGMQL
jgi:hypothetical protein